MCDSLEIYEKYCNTLDQCKKVCRCGKSQTMTVGAEGTRSAHAECGDGDKSVKMCPEGCLSWYDGCNNCRCVDVGKGACTKKFCTKKDRPRCTKWEADETSEPTWEPTEAPVDDSGLSYEDYEGLVSLVDDKDSCTKLEGKWSKKRNTCKPRKKNKKIRCKKLSLDNCGLFENCKMNKKKTKCKGSHKW